MCLIRGQIRSLRRSNVCVIPDPDSIRSSRV